MNRIYLWLLTALLVFSTVGVNAQTGLAGRTYYNANIMAETMNNATKDMDKKMAEARAKRVAPSSEEGTYVIKDKMVIVTDKNNEKDTLRLSDDGNYLYGRFDKETDFKLTRTK